MADIAKLSVGREEYYTRELATDHEQYLSGHGESPGRWYGAGATTLGLRGEASPAGFRRMFEGRHPDSGELLGRPHGRNAVPAFDVVLRPTKSVSILYGLGDASTGRAVLAAHHAGVREAVAYLDEHLGARRGHGGHQHVDGQGLLAVGFDHRTSREGDPLLHTHLVVANRVQGRDGRWTALDGRDLYRHRLAADAIYRASYQREMSRSLGVEWTVADRHGNRELQGMPEDLVRLFSKRTNQSSGSPRAVRDGTTRASAGDHLIRGASLLRLGALAVLWGSGFLWIKVALRGLSPTQIVIAQLATGAAVLVAIVILRRQALPRSRAQWAHLAVMAMVGSIAPYLLFSWGEQHVASSLAGVLNATTPLLTLLFVMSTRAERASMTRGSGITLGFIGVVVLAAPWRSSAGDGSFAGIGACLLAATCYAAGYVYARRFLAGRGFPPLVLAAGQLTIGAVVLGLAAPVIAGQEATLTPSVVASVLVLGLLSTGAAYVLNYRLIQDEGATAASMANYLTPIVAVVLGAVVLGESVTWNLFVGGTVVLLGVTVAEGRFSSGRQPRPGQIQSGVDHTAKAPQK